MPQRGVKIKECPSYFIIPSKISRATNIIISWFEEGLIQIQSCLLSTPKCAYLFVIETVPVIDALDSERP